MNFESAKNKLSEYLEKVKNQNLVRRRKKQNIKNDLSDSLKWPTVRSGLLRLGFLNSSSDRLIGTCFPIGQFERYFENPCRLFVNELLIDTNVSSTWDS